MAQTTQDSKLPSDSTGQEVKQQAVESEGGGVVAGVKDVDESSSPTPSVALHVQGTSSQNSTDARSNTPPYRPSLVPLGSNTSPLTPVAPHPKRFSAVNINKKFLEKNTASGSAATSSSSSTAKAGIPTVARPSIQPASSHSRLVTTKLTASTPVASSTTGWSRPSSVAPPATATNSPSSTSPLPTPAVQSSTTAAPQLPLTGKVILPQPKSTQLGSSQKDSGTKPVWGNIKPPSAPARAEIEPSDFPTAAEVANVASMVRKQVKEAEEAKTTSDTAAKQLRSEEADAFRGVHLDPNVHHWDEMEEDDDNFLNGVIEFGDGRQYKIESSNLPQAGASSAQGSSRGQADESTQKELAVSKEERFVDDFDRSWPKSRNSPASVSKDVLPSSATQHSASPSVSPVISHATQSPHDSSRVLFNERSNRLEPYSQTHRPGQGSFGSKRSSYQEGLGPEFRNVREGSHNIQVLQKSPVDSFGPRGRRFSGSSGGFGSGPANGFTGDRHRDREQPPRRDGPPPSPRMPRDHQSHMGMDTGRELPSDRGRRTAMGPPPLPTHVAQKHSQDGGRQLPPHLAQVSPNIPQRRLSSRDSRFSPSEPLAGLPTSAAGRIPPHSPAVSQASLNLVSPISASNIGLPLTAPELDEARKDVMHSAAERAKQRRQQEEQEREAQKERARRKAAELEEKINAAEAEKERQKQREAEEVAAATAKEQEAISVIEDAVKSVQLATRSAAETTSNFAAESPSMQRFPSLKATPSVSDALGSAGASRRTGAITTRSAPVPTSPAVQTESWRARINPASPLPRQIQPRPPISATFITSGPSAAEQVEFIADGSKDDLEVVDFSDMGKFVGVPDAPEGVSEEIHVAPPATSNLTKRPRAVASDFFDPPNVPEASVLLSKEGGYGAWRRKVSVDIKEVSLLKPVTESKTDVSEDPRKTDLPILTPSPDSPSKSPPVPESSFSLDSSMTSTKEPLSQQDHMHQGQTSYGSQNFNQQRTPRNQPFYKEAAMSALDDAMSRIKGVLVGMHAQEAPKEATPGTSNDYEVQQAWSSQPAPSQSNLRSGPKDRWVPPALRQRKFDDTDEPQEIFLVTVLPPPMVPPPSSSVLNVHLPSVSRPVDFINKKQLQAFSRPPFLARMDILSFDPPVYDMNRRDLSLNDVLFGRLPHPGFKGKFKYRVVIPRTRGPKVNIPVTPLTKANVGAFGRPTAADGATTWRKAVAPPLDADVDGAELNTTSRSPPPQGSPREITVASIPKSNEESPTKSESNLAVRSRSQPKMPEGSVVAFVRDSRIDVVEVDTKPLVNFIIGSQLEEGATSELLKTAPSLSHQDGKNETRFVTGKVTSSSGSTDDHPPSFSSKTESSDVSNDRILVTPPSHHSTASWSRSSASLPIKDSPARPPDPEHLKAVWSQTSNKAGLHAVNSLEGIADDLTALPFTLQDVKSEDGETPPPSLPSAPSRMSLHEVTRAFQTVPTSSSSPSQPPHRASFSPPSTHAPVARPTTATTTYAYSSTPQNHLRSAYVSYPSPMMSHSPVPVIYGGHPMASSPVPSRMQLNGQGHTPLYSQPMWMTMPGPSPQPHGNMMRSVASPYPAQLMYPSPGYAPQHPLPNMMPTTPQGNVGRGRGMPVMSPAMSHTHAHPGSAMMLHAAQVPQSHGHMSAPHQQQRQPHNNHHPPSHPGFNPALASSFTRPMW